MATEPGGILMASSSGALPVGASFPKEFRSGLFGRFDRKFSIFLIVCMVLVFTSVWVLSLRKPPETISEKEITKIQERYARLVLNQPEAKIEPKVAEVRQTVVEKEAPVKKEEVKKEEVKVDREKETFADKKVRKESGSEQRRQVREQNVRQIQSAGIFAALTSTGAGAGGGTTSDLLGQAGLGVTNIGDLSLSKGTFAAKNVDPAALVAKKGERTTDVGITKQTMERTTVTTVASNAQVTVTTQAPEVTGESSSLAERSQSAIGGVVSKESRRLKRLYEEWLKRDPALSGRLTVKFVILPSGAVSSVTVVKSTTNNSEFDDMVIRYIKRWQFPAVDGAGPVEVVYPFVFEGLS